jgi:hypothetical protein
MAIVLCLMDRWHTSVRAQKFLRPAVETRVSLFYLCFQKEAEYMSKLREANAGSSLGPLPFSV